MEKLLLYLYISVLLFCFYHNYHYSIKEKGNHINPYIVFSLSFALYSTTGYLDQIESVRFSFYTKFLYITSCLLGFIAFSLGYGRCYEKISLVDKKDNIIDYSGDWKRIILLIAFIVFCIMFKDRVIQIFTNVGEGSSYNSYKFRATRTDFSGLRSALGGYFYAFYLGFPFYRIFKRKKISLLDACILIPFLLYLLTSGKRFPLLLVLFVTLVFINYRIAPIRLNHLIIMGSVGMLFMVLLGHLRAKNNIADMIDMFKHEDVSFLLSVKSSGEFRNTTRTLFNYIESLSEPENHFQHIIVYLREIIIWVPTFIFPDRPLPLAEQYMLDFYPDAPSGTGDGWFILTDGYMALGYIGIAIELFVYGRLLNTMQKKYFSKIDDPILAMIYAYFLLHIMYSVRSSMLQSAKDMLIDILPLLLIQLFLLKKHKAGEVHENNMMNMADGSESYLKE